MSFNSSPDFSKIIHIAAEILKKDDKLFPGGYPPTDGSNLIVDVLEQEPPVQQSSIKSPLPMIYVSYSRNPIRDVQSTGRDSRNETGTRTYKLEFYTTIIVRELTKELALKKCQELSTIVRDRYQSNRRLLDPDNNTPYAISNEVVVVPVTLRSSASEVQAINVICRPTQIISLRG